MYKLRILQISDLHVRGPRETEAANRYRILRGNKWKDNIDETLSKVPHIDLVVFTGDVANFGKADEYYNEGNQYFHASGFVTELMQMIKLPIDRFFSVPGNHDIDRNIAHEIWKVLRNSIGKVDKHAFSKWLAGQDPPFGLEKVDIDQFLQRRNAYHGWLKHIGRENLLPTNSSHKRLGYRETLKLNNFPFDIHIIGLDSAWLCGDDSDSERLFLTTHQLDSLGTTTSGEPLAGFRLALMHHPISYLHDQKECSPLLSEYFDLILRGHIHQESFETISDPDKKIYSLAAGSLYETSQGAQWPNSLHVVEITLDSLGKPVSYDIFFRSWSSNGFWHDDSSIYKNAKNGKLHIDIPNPL